MTPPRHARAVPPRRCTPACMKLNLVRTININQLPAEGRPGTLDRSLEVYLLEAHAARGYEFLLFVSLPSKGRSSASGPRAVLFAGALQRAAVPDLRAGHEARPEPLRELCEGLVAPATVAPACFFLWVESRAMRPGTVGQQIGHERALVAAVLQLPRLERRQPQRRGTREPAVRHSRGPLPRGGFFFAPFNSTRASGTDKPARPRAPAT